MIRNFQTKNTLEFEQNILFAFDFQFKLLGTVLNFLAHANAFTKHKPIRIHTPTRMNHLCDTLVHVYEFRRGDFVFSFLQICRVQREQKIKNTNNIEYIFI